MSLHGWTVFFLVIFRNIIGWVGFSFLPIDNLKRVLFTFCSWTALPCGAMFSRQLSCRSLGRFHLRPLVKTTRRELIEHIHDSYNNEWNHNIHS